MKMLPKLALVAMLLATLVTAQQWAPERNDEIEELSAPRKSLRARRLGPKGQSTHRRLPKGPKEPKDKKTGPGKVKGPGKGGGDSGDPPPDPSIDSGDPPPVPPVDSGDPPDPDSGDFGHKDSGDPGPIVIGPIDTTTPTGTRVHTISNTAEDKLDSKYWPNWGFITPPAIKKFSFDWVSGDHHLGGIMVYPYSKQVYVGYYDSSPGEDYNWEVTGAQLPGGVIYNSVDSDEFYETNMIGTHPWRGCQGCYTTPPLYSEPGYFAVLQGFHLNFVRGEDHHIDEIKVRVKTDANDVVRVEVCLNDMNDDDGFHYSVKYVLVPKDMLYPSDDPEWTTGRQTSEGASQRTEDFVEIGMPPSQMVRVLTGFEFNFDTFWGDGPIDKIMVDLGAGVQCRVSYRDQNHDDTYFWQVWYTYIDWTIRV